MNNPVNLKDIIGFLDDELKAVYGNPESIKVSYLRDTQHVDKFTLDWVGQGYQEGQKLAEKSKAKAIIAGTGIEYSDKLKAQGKALLIVDNPKLSIAKIGNEFFADKVNPGIHKTAVIDPEAKIGKNVYIGPNVVIGRCHIGDNVIILGNTYVYNNVTIKNNVEIHNGCSIGSEAHNFVKDEYANMIKFPHLGGLIIDNDVLIGANSVISRGVLVDTVIKKGCKIAQLVIVGANNIIEKNCLLRANVVTSGSVRIGENSIIAPSVNIRDHCSIGERCMIGMGAVVTKNVPDEETWIGNPAKKMIK